MKAAGRCHAARSVLKKKLRNNFKVNYNYILTMTSNIMMSIVMALLTAAQMTAAEQIKKSERPRVAIIIIILTKMTQAK